MNGDIFDLREWAQLNDLRNRDVPAENDNVSEEMRLVLVVRTAEDTNRTYWTRQREQLEDWLRKEYGNGEGY